MASGLFDGGNLPIVDGSIEQAVHRQVCGCVGVAVCKLVVVIDALRNELTTVMAEVRRYREVNNLVGDEQQQHRRIAAAIRAGDAEAAEDAMCEHMKSSEGYVRMIEESLLEVGEGSLREVLTRRARTVQPRPTANH